MGKMMAFTLLLAFLLVQAPGLGAMNSCRLVVEAEEDGLLGKEGKPLGPAVLFSDPVTIPAFRMRFVDSKSGQLVVPSTITIAYVWKWLKYPYPEHSWGVWSSASDVVECFEPSAEIQVPEFKVRPRGWYDGKYVKFPFWRRPSFEGILIVLTVNGSTARSTISPKQSMRLKNKTAVFRVNCTGDSTIVVGK